METPREENDDTPTNTTERNVANDVYQLVVRFPKVMLWLFPGLLHELLHR